MTRRWRSGAASCALAGATALLALACAADSVGGTSRQGDHGDAADAGASCGQSASTCDGAAGAAGTTARTNSTPSPAADGDFGNAANTMVETPAAPTTGAASRAEALQHCGPGFYLGAYECEVNLAGLPFPLTGDVSFNLEINEQVVEGECGPSDEFCADLVIAEGSGTLFGLAGLTGFEAPLQGGLDCTTGEFRTDGLEGVYGPAISSDPADPDALWTVAQPPFGMFDGTLSGMHLGAEPQVIDGTWDLADSAGGASCAGTFTVQLQP